MSDEEEVIKPRIKGVSQVSVLDLKAELVRKQQEFQKLKSAKVEVKATKLKLSKPIFKDKKVDLNEEERNKLEQSWVSLSQKAALYDELRQKGGMSEEDDDVLVDFVGKTIQDIKDGTKFKPVKKGDWVEVADEFGRTRIMRKEEAEELQREVDKKLAEENEGYPGDNEGDGNPDAERIPSSSKLYGRTKYFDSSKERRHLGAGFYQFSMNEDTRAQQKEDIAALRRETILSKSRAEILKEKRKEKLEERKALLQSRARERKAKVAEKQADNFLANLI